ncbi:unnamed protein product, partial [Adineta ricciae]
MQEVVTVVNNKGLAEIVRTEGAFIQFSCDKNQVASNNLFTKHLLKNLAEENVQVVDIFQRIVHDVYDETHQKQRPLSINGLKQDHQIFLNYVAPPPAPVPIWVEIVPEEKESFLKEQSESKASCDSLPNVEEITDSENEDVKKAEEFTKHILSKVPSGDLNQMETVCHIVHQLFQNENQECLFFNSRQGVNLYNSFGNLTDLSFDYTPFVLKLKDIREFEDVESHRDDLTIVNTLNRAVRSNEPPPVLEQIVARLATAHNTDKKNIVLKNVYVGSINIVYTVENSKEITMKELSELPKNVQSQFQQRISMKMHPLMKRPTFDVACFDERGHKNFEGEKGTYHIGPPGRTKEEERENCISDG